MNTEFLRDGPDAQFLSRFGEREQDLENSIGGLDVRCVAYHATSCILRNSIVKLKTICSLTERDIALVHHVAQNLPDSHLRFVFSKNLGRHCRVLGDSFLGGVR